MFKQTEFLLSKGAKKDIKNVDGNEAITGIDGDKVGIHAWDGPIECIKVASNAAEVKVGLDKLDSWQGTLWGYWDTFKKLTSGDIEGATSKDGLKEKVSKKLKSYQKGIGKV